MYTTKNILSHISRPILALAILVIALAYSASIVLAAGIVVDSTADNTTAGDGNCTLREAIANANGDSDTTGGDCTAGSGVDTITFAAGIAGGTITLGGTELTISSNLTITGPSAGMTIDGNNASSVFVINSGTVEMSNLTITNGNGVEGGIRNNGTLTLNNCTLTGNTSTEYGSGIFNFPGSTLVINNCTISGNTSNNGGAIADTSSSITINNSTIYNNSTTAAGGGGGLDLYGASSTTNIKNSILAGNSNGSGANNVVTASGATLTSQGYNLESGTDAGFTQPTDLQNTDPQLDTLRDNGSPQTHALLPGSPAIDAGDPTNCQRIDSTAVNSDQRGEGRPVDYDLDSTATCDIGAFELQSDENFTASVGDGQTQTFGAAMVTIADVAGGNSPGSTTVTRRNVPPGSGSPGAGEMPFYVNIQPTTGTSLDINLTICYTDWEVTNAGAGVLESNLVLFRNTGGGSWTEVGFDSRDTVNNCVTKNNVSTLSAWTLGQSGGNPTAITLQSFGARAGGVNGLALPLALVAVVALGAVGMLILRQKRRKTYVEES